MANTMKGSATSSFLRLLLWSVLTLLSVAIIIPVAAFLYFDPNDYKSAVSNFITEKSGLPLEIHGSIQMHYFPWLGFTVQDVSLLQDNTFGRGEFIQIESIDFKVPVRELLKRQLIVETLSLKGLKINLVKNADGTTNWELATKQLKQKAKTTKAPEAKIMSNDTASTSTTSKKKLSFAIAHFDIEQGDITYTDKSQAEVITIKDLSIKGEQKEKGDYPIKGQFDIAQYDNKRKQTGASGHIDFNGHATLGESVSAIFDTTLQFAFPQNPAALRNAKGNVKIHLNPNKSIALEDIRLNIGEQEIKGNANIPADEASPITFLLKMNALDLDKLNSPTAQANPTTATGVIKTEAVVVEAPAKSNNTNNGRALSGEIFIDKLIAKNLQLTNVKASMKKNGGLLKINPLSANLYQGSLNAQITKDLNNSHAPTLLQGDLKNIQIQPLLEVLKNEKRLSGVADINFNLAQNKDVEGVVKVGIKNGTLEGIDVKYYLSLVQSLVSKNKTASEDTKRTAFGDLSATLKIHDQIVDNNDLSITAPDFTTKGEGSIYLNSKTIEYKMQAMRKHSDNQEHPNDFPLAIRIKGSLEHPKVEPDVDLYLKKGLEQEVKKQLNKQLEKNIGKILGAEQSGQDGQTTKPEDAIQQKIEEKLNKGLNKLFKKKTD